MTEAEWQACEDGQEMGRCLREQFNAHRRKAGRRKLRLFGCACCREARGAMGDARSRAAVEFAERLADGEAETARWNALRDDAATAASEAGFCRRTNRFDFDAPGSRAASAASIALSEQPQECVRSHWVIRRHIEAGDAAAHREWRDGHRESARLFRDIFGNPFRPPTPLAPSLLDWNSGVIRQLALATYERRSLPSGHLDRARLAVLADALKEAGYTDADLLGHLRSPGPHVRGCFALDLVLGKS